MFSRGILLFTCASYSFIRWLLCLLKRQTPLRNGILFHFRIMQINEVRNVSLTDKGIHKFSKTSCWIDSFVFIFVSVFDYFTNIDTYTALFNNREYLLNLKHKWCYLINHTLRFRSILCTRSRPGFV